MRPKKFQNFRLPFLKFITNVHDRASNTIIRNIYIFINRNYSLSEIMIKFFKKLPLENTNFNTFLV